MSREWVAEIQTPHARLAAMVQGATMAELLARVRKDDPAWERYPVRFRQARLWKAAPKYGDLMIRRVS